MSSGAGIEPFGPSAAGTTLCAWPLWMKSPSTNPARHRKRLCAPFRNILGS